MVQFQRSLVLVSVVIPLACLSLLGGCSKPTVPSEGGEGQQATPQAQLSGEIHGDGSSTVFPIMEAVAEEFQKDYPGVKVTVGISGTGGGFKKFCAGETDFSDASRPIKPTEAEACQKNSIDYIELPVAYDGLSVMVNPQNNWVDYLTVEELKKIWEPGSKVRRWSDIRPQWPKEEIHLYGPGHDSGTFDYFTEAIVGKEGASRSDYQASEDDNVLVQGVSGDKYALGYFGYAYYEANKEKLKIVPIDGGKGPVTPSMETIQKGTYQPLSRPLFVYIRKDVADRPAVKEFVKYLLTKGKDLVRQVGYLPLPEEAYQLALERFEKRITGSIFGGKGSQVGVKIEDLLRKEGGAK